MLHCSKKGNADRRRRSYTAIMREPLASVSGSEDPYAAVAAEIAAVVEGETNRVARMASVAALLTEAFPRFSWTGFYIVERPGELVVGPYQGRLGCLRIAFGRGVCGTAAAKGETIIVPDVEAFAGHIACDARSRSEIVVPVFDASHALIAVLDVDSTERAAFSQVDAHGLEAIVAQVFAVA
jgi:GAF domain-containing protein